MRELLFVVLLVLLVFVSGCITQSQKTTYTCYDGSTVNDAKQCQNAKWGCNPFPIGGNGGWGNASGADCYGVADNLGVKGKYLFAQDTGEKCEIRLEFTGSQWVAEINGWPDMINPDYFIEFVNNSCKSALGIGDVPIIAWDRGKILKCKPWWGT